MSEFTAEMARERWEYNPDTGIMKWKISPSGNIKVGNAVGCKVDHGYFVTRWKNKYLYVHRIIWLIVHGEWPEAEIDHINGIGTDNRISNLRKSSHQQNMRNRKCHRNGHLPGTVHRKHNRKTPWEARIPIDGKLKYLGRFPTQQLAHAAYLAALKQLEVK